jgi:hypothetical protein
MVMVIVLLGLKYLVPFTSTSRFMNILYVILFSIVGIIIYFVFMFKSKLIYDIFGYDNIEKIVKKIRKR